MSNVFGRLFRVTTFGESHGPAMGAVIDGCPAGMPLSVDDVQPFLARDEDWEALGTARREPNEVQILSGVHRGLTLGTPIALLIPNVVQRPADYAATADTPRPGHGDLPWRLRYGHFDPRGGGRISGREAVARLAAGAVARRLLATCHVQVGSRLTELAGLPVDDEAGRRTAIDRALEIAATGDTSGGRFELSIRGLPPGVGAPVFGKLKAELPAAVLSIGAVTYAIIGDGLDAPGATAGAWNDPIVPGPGGARTASNRCGGLLGGLSTGEEILLRVGVKAPPSVRRPQASVDLATGLACELVSEGRFDTNVTPRVARVAEAMVALVLVDHLLLSGVLPPVRFERERP